MANLTAKDYFVDWYRTADPDITSTKKEARIKAITQVIIDVNTTEYWLEILNIIVKEQPPRDTLENFSLLFRKEDDTFLLLNNLNLLKTLAKILLCFKFEEGDNPASTAVAYAILNYSFLNDSLSKDDIPVYIYAQKYLQINQPYSRSILEQPSTTTELDDSEESLDDIELELSTKLAPQFDFVRDLSDRYNGLAEEVNVLWWVFGEHLNSIKQSFQEAGPVMVALLGAKELKNLTYNKHGFTAAKPILFKIINIAKTDNALKSDTMIELLALIPAIYKEQILEGFDDNYASFLPMLSIFNAGLNIGATEINELLESKFGIQKSMQFPLANVSYQLYNEYLLLNMLS